MIKLGHPYSELYLNQMMENIGYMCSIGVSKGISLDEVLIRFSISSLASGIESGNPHIMAGMNPIDYLSYLFPEKDFTVDEYDYFIGMDYWCGWAFAYLEWYTGLSFRVLYRVVGAEKLYDLYPSYHQMDLSQLSMFADDYILKDDVYKKAMWG